MSKKNDIKLAVDLMNEKEKDTITKLAAEIIKQRIKNIGEYYKYIDRYRDYKEVNKLKKLTRINIPGFGCFYISATNAMFGKNANPSFTDDYGGPVGYFRILRFRPYKWVRNKNFRMGESIG